MDMPVYWKNRARWTKHELIRLKSIYQQLYDQTGDEKYKKVLEWINKKLGV